MMKENKIIFGIKQQQIEGSKPEWCTSIILGYKHLWEKTKSGDPWDTGISLPEDEGVDDDLYNLILSTNIENLEIIDDRLLSCFIDSDFALNKDWLIQKFEGIGFEYDSEFEKAASQED